MTLCSWLLASCAGLLTLVGVINVLRHFLSKIRIRDVNKRSVFITGCDTGFGNSLAKHLDNLGVNVFAGCFTEKGALDLKAATSNRLRTVHLDVTKEESVAEAFQFVKENTDEQGLWGVVNNAGVLTGFGPCEWTSMTDFERICKVNLFGTISVALKFLPLLRPSKGRIVNVCSVAANIAIPGLGNYVISKSAVKMFSACLRRELYGSGISVHIIEPGGFKTNIADPNTLIASTMKNYDRAPEDTRSFYAGNIFRKLTSGISTLGNFNSNNPQLVADAMAHALLSRFPKRGYLVGMDANTLFRALAMMPDMLGDYVLGWPAPYGPTCDFFTTGKLKLP